MSCVLRNCREGGSCRRVTCDIAQISIRNVQMSLRKFLNWMFVISLICDLTLKICIIREGGTQVN